MELIEGSEKSAYVNQTPGNYLKGNLLYSVQDESLKSRITEPDICLTIPGLPALSKLRYVLQQHCM